jgi:hypothetical protein
MSRARSLPATGQADANVSRELNRILTDVELLFNDVHALWEYEDEAAILALWAVSAWFISRYEREFTKIRTVYPYVTSSEPDSGKTELALALSYVTPGAVVCTPTVAAIKRFLNSDTAGTLIIDQFHNLGAAKSTDRCQLDEVLANGHAPGVSSLLADKDTTGNEVRTTFFPKAFFGLSGNGYYRPSGEVSTRLLPFRLHGYTDKEQTDLERRQSERPVREHGHRITYAIDQWITETIAKQLDVAILKAESRTLDDGSRLIKRESDNFRILFALADLAEGKYPTLIRKAAGRMSTGAVGLEPDVTEAERIDGLILDLMRNGRLPVDNWYKQAVSPLYEVADKTALRVTEFQLGWNSGKSRKRSTKDTLPIVTLIISEKEQYAEVRILTKDLPAILTALELNRSDFLKTYLNASRVKHLTPKGELTPVYFRRGDKRGQKTVCLDFTSVVFGETEGYRLPNSRATAYPKDES